MAQPVVIEGTGEEIAQYFRAKPRATQHLRVSVEVPEVQGNPIDPNLPPSSQAMAAFLRQVEIDHRDRPYSDGSDTQALLREARDGAMYDYEPTD